MPFPSTRPRHAIARAIVCAALLFAGALRANAQATMPIATPPAAIVLPHLIVSAELLADLPRRTVTVRLENGGTAAYSGVDLGALLAKNNAPHGPALHGAAAADYAIVAATDGYRVLFSLAELDAGLSDKIVLLADERDGMPLDAKTGPFQIIVPDEKHHLRWIQNVRAIDVAAAP